MTLLGQKQMAYVGTLPLLWGPTAPFYKNWHSMFKVFLHFMGEGFTNYFCLLFSFYKNDSLCNNNNKKNHHTRLSTTKNLHTLQISIFIAFGLYPRPFGAKI